MGRYLSESEPIDRVWVKAPALSEFPPIPARMSEADAAPKPITGAAALRVIGWLAAWLLILACCFELWWLIYDGLWWLTYAAAKALL